MKLKRIVAGISAVAMALSAMSFSAFTTVAEGPADDVFDDLNQQQITEAMQPGWNLGNQLEAVNGKDHSETAWGNPVITPETFKMVKEAGFKSVRIPVSYFLKIGAAPDYTINAAWLDRVKEVVDMALAEGLYAIINMHGDGYNSMVGAGAWLLCNAPDSEQDAIKAKYEACWRQIAEKFKTYDEHLIFESMNEEFDGVTYGAPVDRTYYANINKYNQIFVDTVRKTGAEEGNNAKRWLLIPGWNTNIELTVGDYGFELPTDTNRDASIPENEQRIMISVHYYDPYDFCGQEDTQTTTWGTDTQIKSLRDTFTRCYATFVQKGYPVVIGEYGSIDKTQDWSNDRGNFFGNPQNKNSRILYASEVCKAARSRGMITVYWDNGWNGGTGFALFDRKELKVTQPEIIAAIMDAYKGEAEPAPEIIPPITKDEALAEIKYKENTLIVSGIADEEINGAAQVRYVFDCASKVAFNAYTNVQLSSNVAGTKTSAAVKGDSDLTGVTECESVLSLKNPIKTGDAYYIYMQTSSWKEAVDYVFLIRRVEFLDASGNVIKTIDKSNKPTPAPTLTEPSSTTPKPAPTTAAPTKTTTLPAVTNVTKPAKVKSVKVTAKKKKLNVSWKKVSGATGYEVKAATNNKFTKGKKTATVKKNKATLKKLKAKKMYYVKVRAFKTVNGKKYVGKWSKVVKKKTK